MDHAACIGCGACVPACPAGIELDVIAHLNRDFRRAVIHERRGEQPRRDEVPWLARLRSGPWLQSDPGDQPSPDEGADA